MAFRRWVVPLPAAQDNTHMTPGAATFVEVVANAAALARHLASECGREFACETCGVKYRSHENLLTHGRRRGHVVDR